MLLCYEGVLAKNAGEGIPTKLLQLTSFVQKFDQNEVNSFSLVHTFMNNLIKGRRLKSQAILTPLSLHIKYLAAYNAGEGIPTKLLQLSSFVQKFDQNEVNSFSLVHTFMNNLIKGRRLKSQAILTPLSLHIKYLAAYNAGEGI